MVPNCAFLTVILPLLVSAIPASNERNVVTLSRKLSITRDDIVDKDVLQYHVGNTVRKISKGFENYERNIGERHPNDNRFASAEATDSEPLVDQSNSLWFGIISVGTPAESYTVDFDTGSSDFFLPSSECGTSCAGHSPYDPNGSSSSETLNKTFSIRYGDNSSVSGQLFSDTVILGGMKATGQTIGAAVDYSEGFESANFQPDGLLGMGFQSISVSDSRPVFQTLVSEGQVNSPEFGFTLLPSGSELYLGGVDTSRFSGDLTYSDVTVQGYWQVQMTRANVGATTIASGIDVIVDTGTTLVIGDPESVKQIYEGIPGSKDASQTVGPGMYTVPCNALPDDISFTFGSRDFVISPGSFNLGRLAEESNECVGGIMSQGGLNFWVLGDVFLRNVYTSFDFGNARVGFAEIK